MALENHQLLLIGFNDTEAVRIVSTLGAFELDFHRVAWSDGLLGFVASREFDTILLRYPQHGRVLAGFLEALRQEQGYSRHAGVVILVERARLAFAHRFLGHGVNRVVPLERIGDELRESVLNLLDVSRRFPLRTPIRLSGTLNNDSLTAHCHTENLSMSGMLVCCSKRFPVGAPIEFSLCVPGERQPIRGKAQVARLTDPRRERVVGMGARFVDFSEDHRSRLRNLLLHQAS